MYMFLGGKQKGYIVTLSLPEKVKHLEFPLIYLFNIMH